MSALPATLAPKSPAPVPAPAARLSLQALRDALPQHLRHRLRSARELAREAAAAPLPPLPTGTPALDRMLGGGLPRGRLVELVGSRSSGRFSLVLAALAAATGAGEAAALVDLGDALDPRAAEAAGADLARLLWARPRRLAEALAAAEALLAGGFPLVTLDLGLPPLPGGWRQGGRGHAAYEPGRAMSGGGEPIERAVSECEPEREPGRARRGRRIDPEAAWTRLARAAEAVGAALLVASPYRVSGTAAGVVVACSGGRAVWGARNEESKLRRAAGAPPLLTGVAAHLRLEKDRVAQRTGSERLELRVP